LNGILEPQTASGINNHCLSRLAKGLRVWFAVGDKGVGLLVKAFSVVPGENTVASNENGW